MKITSEESFREALRFLQGRSCDLSRCLACLVQRRGAMSAAAERMPSPLSFDDLWSDYLQWKIDALPQVMGPGAGDETPRDHDRYSAGPTDL